MINAEIIICTEKGILESKSKLLVYSIRKFGGRFKDIPIFSYQPRKDFKISNDTISFFKKNNVEFIDLDLNKEYKNYPLANKPIVCAHRELNTDADVLIFIDSDVFILNEPKEFFEFDDAEIIIRPVHEKNIGTNNQNDNKCLYWKKLYELLNVRNKRYVKTTFTNERILEYYNSGLIATFTKNGLFKIWNDNFNKVMNSDIRPNRRLFLEQTILSATISQLELKVKEFSKFYNFPILKDRRYKNKKYFITNVDELVSVHYHKYFEKRYFNSSILKSLFKTKKGKNIKFKLRECGLITPYTLFFDIKLSFIDKIKMYLKQ